MSIPVLGPTPPVIVPFPVATATLARWLGKQERAVWALRTGRKSPGWEIRVLVAEVIRWPLDEQAAAYLDGVWPAWFNHRAHLHGSTLNTPPCACGCGVTFIGERFGPGHQIGWLNRQVSAAYAGNAPAVRATVSLVCPGHLTTFDRLLEDRHVRARKRAAK